MATLDHSAVEGLHLPPAMIETATAAADWIIILPVVLCLMGGAFLLVLSRQRYGQAGFAILIVGAVVLCDALLLMRVLDHGPTAMTMGKWLPPFGISFTADVMSAAFALASAFVTLIVLIYMRPELQAREIRYGFYPLVLILLAGVTGAFLTGDLFNLYVWFEVLLIASFGLMVMGGRKIQLDAALKYGFINFLATTFFLIGLGFLYGMVGTLNMADIIIATKAAPETPMLAIAALMLLAFGMKAAAFPVNAWLPASYHAPDAGVSALFAGLLTKVGAYALLRTLVVLMPDARDTLEPVIVVIAVATLVIAPLGAIAETNLRRALGFLVMGGIGSIFAAIAMPSISGLAGGTIYAFNSMLVMSAFYLVAGLVEKVTGELDTRRMGGVYTASSPLSILFLLLVFAAAGLPPFLGFWPKFMLIEAAWFDGSYWLLAAILVNSLLTSIAGARLWAHIFWRVGHEGDRSEQPNTDIKPLSREYTLYALVPTAVLVALVTGMGMMPNFILTAGAEAASTLLDSGRYIAAVGLGGTQ